MTYDHDAAQSQNCRPAGVTLAYRRVESDLRDVKRRPVAEHATANLKEIQNAPAALVSNDRMIRPFLLVLGIVSLAATVAPLCTADTGDEVIVLYNLPRAQIQRHRRALRGATARSGPADPSD